MSLLGGSRLRSLSRNPLVPPIPACVSDYLRATKRLTPPKRPAYCVLVIRNTSCPRLTRSLSWVPFVETPSVGTNPLFSVITDRCDSLSRLATAQSSRPESRPRWERRPCCPLRHPPRRPATGPHDSRRARTRRTRRVSGGGLASCVAQDIRRCRSYLPPPPRQDRRPWLCRGGH